MDVRHLEEYIVLAELGSFTLASRELHITQSALSKHIAVLEREFGTALFERTGRGAVMTLAGEKLLEHARAILCLVAKAKSDVSSSIGRIGSLVVKEGRCPDYALRRAVAEHGKRYGLDRRETEVLVGFLEGESILSVGADLGIGRDEAADLIAGAYGKLGVGSKEEALRRLHSHLE